MNILTQKNFVKEATVKVKVAVSFNEPNWGWHDGLISRYTFMVGVLVLNTNKLSSCLKSQ